MNPAAAAAYQEILFPALQVISILITLVCLGMDVAIWWMLVGGEVQEYRRAFRAEMVRRWCCGDEEEEVVDGTSTRAVNG